MALGDSERQAVALPSLPQSPFQAVGRWLDDANRLDVREAYELVAAATLGRVAIRPVVEEAVAGQVVVQTQHVGRARSLGDRLEARLQTEAHQPVPQGVALLHSSAEQIPAQPPALVVEAGLMGDGAGGIGAAEVLGLDQASGWVDLADRGHGQADAVDLVEQSFVEAALVQQVRMPEAVESGEPSCGQGLVDRRPFRYPRISLRRRRREPRQPPGEFGVDQAGIGGTRAVVDEAPDRTDAELAHPP